MSWVLVTGATAGIGAQFAGVLAEKGHDVVLVARDRARLENVSDDLRRTYGVATEILVADLADRAQVGKVAERLADEAEPIDLLVNNAGFGMSRSFLRNPVEQEEELLDVLCRAVLVLSHAAATAMRARGRGAIVNVSSVAGFAAMGTYSAAKSWVTVFSEALGTELSGTGVSVTALCPGFVRTEFHDRAGIDMGGLPAPMWLDARRLVVDALDDVARGRAVSVPGLPYRVLVAAMGLVPRSAVRRGSRFVQKRRNHERNP